VRVFAQELHKAIRFMSTMQVAGGVSVKN